MSQCNWCICVCIYPICDIAMHICQGLVFHALEKPQRGGGGIELSRRRTFPLWRHPASAAYIQSPWETLSCLRGQVEKGLDNFFALITFKNHSLKLIWMCKRMKVARHTLLCLPASHRTETGRALFIPIWAAEVHKQISLGGSHGRKILLRGFFR